MPAPMMKLGDYTFSINTAAYRKAKRNSKYNWPEQARIGSNPVLQFSGTGADTMSLPGIIYPTFRGGLTQVDTMRALAGRAKPLLLVDGLGSVHGYWCITGIKEKTSDFLPAGIPQKIEFTLDLTYFGEKI